MRVLVLARHAKAEPHVGDATDHARPLALRGRTDAKELGAILTAHDLVPDVAYVSDALRTAQTWDLAAAEWDVPEVHRRRELYNTSVATLVSIVAGTPAGASTAMVVGHEPTMSAAATLLAGQGSDREALRLAAMGLPTGAAAVIEVDGEWADLGARAGRLRAILGRDH